MSGDHDLWRRSVARRIEPPFAHAERVESFADDWIVDEFTENGERSVRCEFLRLSNGVADAEAKTVVFC